MMLIFFILDDGVWNFVRSYLPDKIYFMPAFIRQMKVNPVPLRGRVWSIKRISWGAIWLGLGVKQDATM
jgi:hypothetical protein